MVYNDRSSKSQSDTTCRYLLGYRNYRVFIRVQLRKDKSDNKKGNNKEKGGGTESTKQRSSINGKSYEKEEKCKDKSFF